jgi:hypothetical protein
MKPIQVAISWLGVMPRSLGRQHFEPRERGVGEHRRQDNLRGQAASPGHINHRRTATRNLWQPDCWQPHAQQAETSGHLGRTHFAPTLDVSDQRVEDAAIPDTSLPTAELFLNLSVSKHRCLAIGLWLVLCRGSIAYG